MEYSISIKSKLKPGSSAYTKYQLIRLDDSQKEMFRRAVKLKLQRTWYSRFNPYALPVDPKKAPDEIARYIDDFSQKRKEWFDDDPKPLRSPGMEVGILSPVSLNWNTETTERDISMDELAEIEMEESRNERERYRRLQNDD